MSFGSDILFEGKVLSIEDTEEEKTGWVDFHGVRMPVNLSLLPEIVVGQKIVVYRRVALSTVEEGDEICR